MDFSTVQDLVRVHGTPTLFCPKSRVREGYRALKNALPRSRSLLCGESNATPETGFDS
jgi:diaminopimelate decarboxylase